jgi:PPM family protein phosphatase
VRVPWKRSRSVPAPLTFRSSSASYPGTYEINEDAAGEVEVERFALHALADGLGGHALGEVAARLAVERAIALFRARPSLGKQTLERIVLEAHRALGAEAESRGEPDGVRSTLVLLALDGGTARWAHVGDSRLYHFRGGRVRTRTLDHSVPEMLHRTGELAEDDIRGHPDRGRLLQVLGQEGEPRVSVSERTPLEPGDAFLLCSDGWWDPVREMEMEALLRAAGDPEEWLAGMRERIEATARSSQDNYTATGIMVS